MKWLFALFCLLHYQVIYAKMPDGPCASEKHYPGLAEKIEDKSIPYTKERVDEQDLICWQLNYNDAVHDIMEEVSGLPPSQYSYSVDSPKLMNEVSTALSEEGISHKRGVFNKNEYLEWSSVDDKKSIEVIKAKTGYDINRTRSEIKKVLEQKYNNSLHSAH